MFERCLSVVVLSALLAAGGCERLPVAPGGLTAGTPEQLVSLLRQRGMGVERQGELPRESFPFMSVPAERLLVNGAPVHAFAYASVGSADADIATLSTEGTVRVTWISRPQFYQQERLTVLYVGCAAEILEALERAMGPPVLTGTTPCT